MFYINILWVIEVCQKTASFVGLLGHLREIPTLDVYEYKYSWVSAWRTPPDPQVSVTSTASGSFNSLQICSVGAREWASLCVLFKQLKLNPTSSLQQSRVYSAQHHLWYLLQQTSWNSWSAVFILKRVCRVVWAVLASTVKARDENGTF